MLGRLDTGGNDEVCVHQLIRRQVERRADRLALIDGDRRYTYRQLHARACRLANRLVESGVGPGGRVGVCCARSADMIAALLAILEAGAAYVPLDPGHPRARLESVIADAGVRVVLSQQSVGECLPARVRRLCVDDPALTRGAPTASPAVAGGPDMPMFVLYTSGSTGEPKGVVCTHRAIASRLLWGEQTYPYAAGEIASARTPLGFVDSVAEIFAPLAFGVPLVMIGDEAQRDPQQMVHELGRLPVTRVVMVPSLLSTVLDIYPDVGERLPSLRYWFVGGEPVPVTLVARFREHLRGRKLINLYGATEVSGDATYYDFDDMSSGMINAPIGKPVRGTLVRVLDDRLREVADGDVGEIYISGVCLARGYVGRPEQTTARFVDNPFGEGGALYRTGDLGRRMPTGDIEYLGRLDQQVKIRGMRVELPAVESLLSDCAAVAQAVAVAHTDDAGCATLVAFFTASGRGDTSPTALREHLAGLVPDFMVPSHFVELDHLPRNANGKVDRRVLRDRPIDATGGLPYSAPIGDDERRIAAIWQRVLVCGPVGRDHSFHQLGGNSLAAARIVAAVREAYQVPLPIRALFECPTVGQLADEIVRLQRQQRKYTALVSASPALEPSGEPIPAVLPLSHYQLPFWFFRAVSGEVSVVSELFGFSAPVDVDRLQQAFSDTVGQFDALWMRLPRWRPVQCLVARRPCAFSVSDLRDRREPIDSLIQAEVDCNRKAGIDLDKPPLVRARLLLLPNGDQRLAVAIPHAVVDMSSMELFRGALEARYAGEPAARAPVTLADLVRAERLIPTNGRDADDRRYWADIGAGPAWNLLPPRLFRSKRAGARTRAFSSRAIAAATADRLGAYCERRRVSVPIALVAALHAAVARTVGRDDVTLLLMLEKREVEATQALFTTLAALMRFHLRPGEGATLDQLVDAAGRQLMASYERTDGLMRWPTLFNDFWLDAPLPVRAAVRWLCRTVVRAWPQALLAGDCLADYLFAIVPNPASLVRERFEPPATGRRVLICLNIMPEVYQPDVASSAPVAVVRDRRLEHIIGPSDLIINSDPLLDRALQVHVSRDRQGALVINLYGGGIDQSGLDELCERIVAVVDQLARGDSTEPVQVVGG